MREYYLYRHIRPDLDIPFYIGIGTKKTNEYYISAQSEYPRAFMSNDKLRSNHWVAVFKQCNCKILIDILYESPSISVIKQKEREFISMYGRNDLRKGSLVNLTDGGEGRQRHSAKTLLKMSLAGKARVHKKHTEESRKKMSEVRRKLAASNPISEELREKLSISHRGKKHSDETKQKMSLAQKGKIGPWAGKKLSETHRLNMSKAHKQKRNEPEN